MDTAVLEIDLGKNSYGVVGFDGTGRVTLRKRLTREGVRALAQRLPACRIGMEACCGTHHLARELTRLGHDVRFMSPEYVRPYIKAQKNDERDAEAIAEAVTRPTMRFVEIKSAAQLDVQTLHRSRDRLVSARTALINQLRSILLERGLVLPEGRKKLSKVLDERLANTKLGLNARITTLIADLRAEWDALDRRIEAFDDEFPHYARHDEAARRLTTIPGIGVLNATALCAAVGDARAFERGRDLAAWLGLVPRHATTWGQAEASEYQQAGQQVSAQAPHPRRARRNAHAGQECHTAGRMAARSPGPRPRERRCGRAGA